MLTRKGPSPEDPRNEMGSAAGAYSGDWKTLFTDTESLARGKWSAPKTGATFHDAYRRYGASKLCEVMFMYAALLSPACSSF